MRCNNCNKMVSLDTEQDPEVDSLEVDTTGAVQANVRIANVCADCGEELRQASFDSEVDLPDLMEHIADRHKEDEPDLEIEEMSKERVLRTQGHSRWMKTFYGARIEFEVKCGCGETFSGELTDEIQASGMDEV